MTPEQKKLITERYTDWAGSWGLSLAFAVTQDLEKSERIVADAIVALIAAEIERQAAAVAEAKLAIFRRAVDPHAPFAAPAREDIPVSVTPVRFSRALWELASDEAYRAFGAEPFFRMPAVARAIVVLKIKAQFSRAQIAAALDLDPLRVDDHLENARLLFSDGRSWMDEGPALQVDGTSWAPRCSLWRDAAAHSADGTQSSTAAAGATAAGPNSYDLQGLFAQYVGNDLAPEEGRKLHSHLVSCDSCRTGFAQFKRQYLNWSISVPSIEPDEALKKHFGKITKMALKVQRGGPPSAMPGIRRVFRDSHVRAMVLGAALVMAAQIFFHKHSHLPRILRRLFH